MQKYLSFIMYYGNALLLFTRKLHCFDRSLHVGSLDTTFVQIRPVPLTVFEIQGFKLKKTTTRIIEEIDFLPYLPC